MPECTYDRDCRYLPIPERCLSYCLAELLRNASVEEYQLVLGLDGPLAEALGKAYEVNILSSYRDLTLSISPEQIRTLEEKFRGINQFQLTYLNRSREEREPILGMIKDLRLDTDNDSIIDYIS